MWEKERGRNTKMREKRRSGIDKPRKITKEFINPKLISILTISKIHIHEILTFGIQITKTDDDYSNDYD